MRKSLCCAWMAVAMTASCFAASSPWDGTWKVNEAKSKFTGGTFTISEKGGMMHYANGGPVEYDFACDGKGYKTVADHTFACMKTGDSYATVSKVKGEEVSRAQREISKDGRTMTITSTGRQVDGSEFSDKVMFTRVSGSQGMVGTWKSMKDSFSGTEIAKVSLADGVMHMEYPSAKESVAAKLGGPPSPITGPRVPAGLTMEMKADGPLSVHYMTKFNGKVSGEGMVTLSADGKTLTDTSWLPGKMNEKEIAVYDRQ